MLRLIFQLILLLDLGRTSSTAFTVKNLLGIICKWQITQVNTKPLQVIRYYNSYKSFLKKIFKCTS